ncbi:MAG: ATP-binding domain-containing protein, partial [Acetatifactor sp.]|nr:ATP-binding domain-containing protein [Acetatifactor sp.]
DCVWLMTLHASKGLEFSHVFIIGVNYGLIPLHPSGFEEEEEERRLFFVGMTRARDYLELSYYTQPALPKVVPGESRYLQMIPERLVERVDDNAVTKPVNILGKAVSGSEEWGAEENRVESTAEQAAATEPTQPRMVRHAKYGVGVVIGESEEKITVDFGELGSKSFMKEFVSLEPVSDM